MSENDTNERGGAELSEADMAIEYVGRLAKRQRADSLALIQMVHGFQLDHETHVRKFIGWLSVDIPELHNVDVPLLAESWERFKARERSQSDDAVGLSVVVLADFPRA